MSGKLLVEMALSIVAQAEGNLGDGALCVDQQGLGFPDAPLLILYAPDFLFLYAPDFLFLYSSAFPFPLMIRSFQAQQALPFQLLRRIVQAKVLPGTAGTAAANSIIDSDSVIITSGGPVSNVRSGISAGVTCSRPR